MKKTILFILLSLTLNACNNKKYGDKTLITGSRIYLNIPNGYKLGVSFIGLDKGEIEIQIEESSDSYFSEIKYLTKESFEEDGLKLIKGEDLKIDNYPAKIAYYEYESMKKMTLIFGNNDFYVISNVFIPDFEKKTTEEINKIFLSIKYDKERIIPPLDNAVFKINDSNNTYKYSKMIDGVFMYTKKGTQEDDLIIGKPNYGVTQYRIYNSESNLKYYFEKSLRHFVYNGGFRIATRKKIERNKLNGFDECYEEIITGYIFGIEIQLIITVFIKDDKAIVVNAVAYDNFESEFKEFNKLTNELKMK